MQCAFATLALINMCLFHILLKHGQKYQTAMRFQASFHIIIFLACLIPSAVAGGHIDSSMYSITGYFDSYRCSTHFKQLWPLEVYQLWGGIPIDISNIDSVNAYYIIKKVESEFRCAGMCSRRTYLYYQVKIWPLLLSWWILLFSLQQGHPAKNIICSSMLLAHPATYAPSIRSSSTSQKITYLSRAQSARGHWYTYH